MGFNLLLAYLPAAKITKQRRCVLHRLIAKLSAPDLHREEITAVLEGSHVRQMLHEYVNLLPVNPWEHREVIEMAEPQVLEGTWEEIRGQAVPIEVTCSVVSS